MNDEEKLYEICKDLQMLCYRYTFESPEYKKKNSDFKKLADKTINHLLSNKETHKIKIDE